MTKVALAFAVVFAVSWRAALAQTACSDLTACAGCKAETGCDWCQINLKDNSTGLADMRVGVCRATGECPVNVSEDSDPILTGFAKAVSADGVYSATSVVVSTDEGDCPSPAALATLSADVATCSGCVANGGGDIYCRVGLKLDSTEVLHAGICMPTEACIAGSFVVDGLEGATTATAADAGTCPTCGDQTVCTACNDVEFCLWCAPEGVISGSSETLSEQILGVGLCGESCASLTAGTVANIFADVPTDPLTLSVAVKKSSDTCTATASTTAWSTLATCDDCIAQTDHSWCSIDANTTIAGAAAVAGAGGVCMAADDTGCPTTAETVDELVDGTAVKVTYQGELKTDCAGVPTTPPLTTTPSGASPATVSAVAMAAAAMLAAAVY